MKTSELKDMFSESAKKYKDMSAVMLQFHLNEVKRLRAIIKELNDFGLENDTVKQ